MTSQIGPNMGRNVGCGAGSRIAHAQAWQVRSDRSDVPLVQPAMILVMVPRPTVAAGLNAPVNTAMRVDLEAAKPNAGARPDILAKGCSSRAN